MARLFVAVRPPSEVLDALVALVRPERPGLRWTTPEQWHVTLRFLGEVDDVGAAVAALDSVRAGTAVALAGPRTRRLGPGVVCVPVGGLGEVAAAVVAATADIGRPPERRRFTGHLTLARLKRPAAFGPDVEQPFEARWPVNEIELVQSRLDRAGARYTALHAVALAPVDDAPAPPT